MAWPRHYIPIHSHRFVPVYWNLHQEVVQDSIHSIDYIDIPTANITGIRITFTAGSQPVNFINVYNKHDSQTLAIVEEITRRLANEPTHILGDFNAHHPAWNPNDHNIRPELETEEMVAQMIQRNYSLKSPKGIPTRYGHNSATTIDLYWLSSKMVNYESVFCSVDNEIDTTSDHRPLHVYMKVDYADTEIRKRWNLKKANWEAGTKKLQRLLQGIADEPILTPEELDHKARRLTENITAAIDA